MPPAIISDIPAGSLARCGASAAKIVGVKIPSGDEQEETIRCIANFRGEYDTFPSSVL